LADDDFLSSKPLIVGPPPPSLRFFLLTPRELASLFLYFLFFPTPPPSFQILAGPSPSKTLLCGLSPLERTSRHLSVPPTWGSSNICQGSEALILLFTQLEFGPPPPCFSPFHSSTREFLSPFFCRGRSPSIFFFFLPSPLKVDLHGVRQRIASPFL